jgi:hypothetical protein
VNECSFYNKRYLGVNKNCNSVRFTRSWAAGMVH